MPGIAMSSQPISVDHVTITSKRPFSEVRAALETNVPPLDTNIMVQLSNGDHDAIAHHEQHGPTLFIFLQRDHGALLAITGGRRNAIQYEIGNPIIASKMTRHNLMAALYAPLRIVLFEADDGRAVFEYDKPSTLFGQIGNDEITRVGLYLDHELEAVLLKAAGE
jgi:uncharacterized protein (DUF302 family)